MFDLPECIKRLKIITKKDVLHYKVNLLDQDSLDKVFQKVRCVEIQFTLENDKIKHLISNRQRRNVVTAEDRMKRVTKSC